MENSQPLIWKIPCSIDVLQALGENANSVGASGAVKGDWRCVSGDMIVNCCCNVVVIGE